MTTAIPNFTAHFSFWLTPVVYADLMVLKFGLLTAIGLIVGLILLVWIQPETVGGQALLTVIVVALMNGLGGLLWPASRQNSS